MSQQTNHAPMFPLPGQDLRQWANDLVATLQRAITETGASIGTEVFDTQGRIILDANGVYNYDSLGNAVITPTLVKIDTDQLAQAAVATANVADRAINTAQIADAAILSAKIGALQVIDAKIATLTVNKLTSGTIASADVQIAGTGQLRAGKVSAGDPAPGFWFDGSGAVNISGNVTISGSVTITGGSGIGNLSDAGALAVANNVDWVTQVLGTGKPADNATVGATWGTDIGNQPNRLGLINLLEGALLTTQSNTFVEAFEQADVLSTWTTHSSTGELLIVSGTTDSTTGGKVLQVGNNSGSDEWLGSHINNIPFNPNALYRIRIRIKRPLGNGFVKLGFLGIAKDGVTIVDVGGLTSVSNGHFHAGNTIQPTTTYQIFEGYTLGFGGTLGTNGLGTLATPGKMHPDVRYIRPLAQLNFASATGQMVMDYFIVEVIPNAQQIGFGDGQTLEALQPAQAGATAGATWNGNIGNQPVDLAGINSSEGAKLTGIATGATVGATWDGNIGGQPTSLVALNNADGTKLAGIADNATVGATWGTDVGNQPTNLAAINSGEGSKLAGIATGATANSTAFQVIAPGSPQLGDLWYNTTTGVLSGWDGVGWTTAGDLTSVTIANGLVTAGFIELSTAGNIRSGQTGWNQGSGWWIGNDAGTPKFSIGVAGGNGLVWDGTTLGLVGDFASSNGSAQRVIIGQSSGFVEILDVAGTRMATLGLSGGFAPGTSNFPVVLGDAGTVAGSQTIGVIGRGVRNAGILGLGDGVGVFGVQGLIQFSGGAGIIGETRALGSIGVEAFYNGPSLDSASTNSCPFRIRSYSIVQPPNWVAQKGSFYVSGDGALYYNKTGGSTWIQLA